MLTSWRPFLQIQALCGLGRAEQPAGPTEEGEGSAGEAQVPDGGRQRRHGQRAQDRLGIKG